MSGSNGLKRYNGVEQDDEGAYVYYDEHDAALRAAKAKVWREAATVHRQADGNDCKYCLARAAQIEEGSDVPNNTEDG